jgi:hypothetical protein
LTFELLCLIIKMGLITLVAHFRLDSDNNPHICMLKKAALLGYSKGRCHNKISIYEFQETKILDERILIDSL